MELWIISHTQVLSIILFFKIKKVISVQMIKLERNGDKQGWIYRELPKWVFSLTLSGLWNRKCCCLPIANAGILTWKRFKFKFDLPVGYYMYVPSKIRNCAGILCQCGLTCPLDTTCMYLRKKTAPEYRDSAVWALTCRWILRSFEKKNKQKLLNIAFFF